MTNVIRLFEAASGIKADKFKTLNDLESVFEAILDKELKGLFILEEEIVLLNKSIFNASKLSHRMDFERELNKKYRAYSLALAKVAVRVDKHWSDRLTAMEGL